MPKGRPARSLLPVPAYPSGDPSSSSGRRQQPPLSQSHLEGMRLTFNDGDVDYNTQDHAMDSDPSVLKNKKSIKSNSSLYLTGPMHVDGSVKSMGSVSFVGDFTVRDRIEAYGNIEANGNVTCYNKVKTFGNLDISGYVFSGSKVKVFGKLVVNGHLEVSGDIEVWGTIVIQGYIKCKTLTAYASVTTVGSNSYYEVDEAETVWGAKLVRHTEDEA